MKYCNKCGNQIDTSKKFCGKCGEKNKYYIEPVVNMAHIENPTLTKPLVNNVDLENNQREGLKKQLNKAKEDAQRKKAEELLIEQIAFEEKQKKEAEVKMQKEAIALKIAEEEKNRKVEEERLAKVANEEREKKIREAQRIAIEIKELEENNRKEQERLLLLKQNIDNKFNTNYKEQSKHEHIENLSEFTIAKNNKLNVIISSIVFVSILTLAAFIYSLYNKNTVKNKVQIANKIETKLNTKDTSIVANKNITETSNQKKIVTDQTIANKLEKELRNKIEKELKAKLELEKNEKIKDDIKITTEKIKSDLIYKTVGDWNYTNINQIKKVVIKSIKKSGENNIVNTTIDLIDLGDGSRYIQDIEITYSKASKITKIVQINIEQI